jgi:hypothetical protein
MYGYLSQITWNVTIKTLEMGLASNVKLYLTYCQGYRCQLTLKNNWWLYVKAIFGILLKLY